MTRIKPYWLTVFLIINFSSLTALASGNTVGKFYTPYVQQLEHEIEYEYVIQSDSRSVLDQQQRHKFAYGQSLSDFWYVEFGLLGSNNPTKNFSIEGFEIEIKRQLTEQGEFNNDWAIMFELETETDPDVWELGTTLIVLHEWNKWVGTGNFTIAYESLETKNELELELSAQLRYRHHPYFEPAIELFQSQDINAIGPSVTGQLRLGGAKKLAWSTGAVFSLDSDKADTSYRFNLEYEF